MLNWTVIVRVTKKSGFVSKFILVKITDLTNLTAEKFLILANSDFLRQVKCRKIVLIIRYLYGFNLHNLLTLLGISAKKVKFGS